VGSLVNHQDEMEQMIFQEFSEKKQDALVRKKLDLFLVAGIGIELIYV